jgi:hypothetical protein
MRQTKRKGLDAANVLTLHVKILNDYSNKGLPHKIGLNLRGSHE